jgi:uncharacterized protein YwgA
MYMLKSSGTAPDYQFSWYVRGPYSVGLSSDAYAFYSNPKNLESPVEFSSDERIVIDKIKSFLSEDLKDLDKLDSRLELSASLLFLSDERKMDLSDFQLVSLLHSFKPWFSMEDIEIATKKLAACGLFN